MVPASFSPGATVLPEAGQWAASLAVIAGPGLGQQVKLGPGVLSVGRSPGNGLSIPDTTVSSRHALFETDGEGCWVRDAGSVNGTFVNGQRIQRHFLRPGDVVSIGPARLRFDVSA
ncbi:MAG: FHA domain-containing protein [Myxococcales bacterium]|nr:MAG: FHA domain-containing protein [Myxococcales bacterium]